MRRSSYTRLALVAASAAAASAVALTAAPSPASATPPVTFGVPRIVDPIHAYG